MRKWRLVNYFDVWGNPKDGWEINNQCVEFDELWMDDGYTAKDVLRFLKRIGFLATDDMRRLAVEDSWDSIEVFERRGMKPLCALITEV